MQAKKYRFIRLFAVAVLSVCLFLLLVSCNASNTSDDVINITVSDIMWISGTPKTVVTVGKADWLITENDSHEYLIYDFSGKSVTEEEFDYIADTPCDGVLSVKKDGKIGFINENAQTVFFRILTMSAHFPKALRMPVKTANTVI